MLHAATEPISRRRKHKLYEATEPISCRQQPPQPRARPRWPWSPPLGGTVDTLGPYPNRLLSVSTPPPLAC